MAIARTAACLFALAAGSLPSVAADAWEPLTKQNPLQTGFGYSLVNYKGDIIATGLFDSTKYLSGPAIPTRRVVKWNGSEMSSLGAGIKSAYEVFCSYVWKDELYVGGDRLDSAGSVKVNNNMAKWNGTEWAAVGDGPTDIGIVYAFREYKGELYAGAKGGLYKWSGTSWANIVKLPAKGDAVHSLEVYKEELYVGGTFFALGTDSVKNIARYDGSKFSPVGTGVIANQYVGTVVINRARVAVMEEFQGELYLGGDFDSAGTLKAGSLLRWNGSALASAGGGANSSVRSLVAHGPNLYVAGYFWKVGDPEVDANRAASWNGSAWKGLGTLASGGNGLAVRNDTLYGLAAREIHRWTGSIGSGTVAAREEARRPGLRAEYRNGYLILSGIGARDSRATLHALDGSLILRLPAAGPEARYRLAGLADGGYFLRVRSPSGAFVRRFVKY